MQARIDPVKIGSGVLKPGPRADRAVENGATRDNVRELPAYSHDLLRVGDSLEEITLSYVGRFSFRNDRQGLGPRPEP